MAGEFWAFPDGGAPMDGAPMAKLGAPMAGEFWAFPNWDWFTIPF